MERTLEYRDVQEVYEVSLRYNFKVQKDNGETWSDCGTTLK